MHIERVIDGLKEGKAYKRTDSEGGVDWLYPHPTDAVYVIHEHVSESCCAGGVGEMPLVNLPDEKHGWSDGWREIESPLDDILTRPLKSLVRFNLAEEADGGFAW